MSIKFDIVKYNSIMNLGYDTYKNLLIFKKIIIKFLVVINNFCREKIA